MWLLPFLDSIFYNQSILWTIGPFGSLSLGFVTKATEEELKEKFPSRGRACKSKAAPPSKESKTNKTKDAGKKSNGDGKDSEGPSAAKKAVPKPKAGATKAVETPPETSQPSKRLRKPRAEAEKESPDPAAVFEEPDCEGHGGDAMRASVFSLFNWSIDWQQFWFPPFDEIVIKCLKSSLGHHWPIIDKYPMHI